MSEDILSEYETVLERVKQEQHFTTETGPWLDALRKSALWVTPMPFEEKVCRDPKDDKFIEAALAAGAKTIHCARPDLTVLEKPFGIAHANPALSGWAQ